ncbi:MAG: M20 metallopeptidase family protein [Gemmatimonadota bacterium]
MSTSIWTSSTSSPFARRLSLPDSARSLFTPFERAALIDLRRNLHAHPELSGLEVRTARVLAESLRSAGASDVRIVAGTGVTGRVGGTRPGAPVVALRGDIDALPITEETGLSFSSTVPGVMHACGHDVHSTWTVGAAMLLARSPAIGDVVIVLQPAEETGSGALAILETGLLVDVDCIFGGHVDRRFPTGAVIAEAGPLAASADTFRIDLIGRGAHGARPHEASDPVVAAAAIIMVLQTVVARRVDPAVPAVVTIGSIHAGDAPNVIPERATLSGTLRAMDAAVRQKLIDEVSSIATGIAAAMGVEAKVAIERGTPPIVNPRREAAWAASAAQRVLGREALVPFGITNMAGEDFAFYMERMPGCFLRFGAREPGGAPASAHSPRFTVDEDAIFVGAAVLAECARIASAEIRGAEAS